MRLTMLQYVQPDAILGKTIYDENGRPMLIRGTQLTSSYIRRLLQSGYVAVYIDDPLTRDLPQDDTFLEDMKGDIIEGIREAFGELMDPDRVQLVWPDKVTYRISDLFDQMIESIRTNRLYEIHLASILNKDETLYHHSFNVALCTVVMASARGLDQARVREYGMGALLHDIGMVAVPSEIIAKPGKLTNEEWPLVKKHPIVGYNIILRQRTFSTVSAHAAYQHHERLDGSGYPRGLTGSSIHLVGRMTAVADVYAAMTSARPYKKPLLPSEVMEYLYVHAGSKFDAECVRLLRNHVALYPVGVTVTLSDGRQGVVVRNNTAATLRPIVRIFAHEGSSVSPYDFDMSQTLNVTICGFELNAPLHKKFVASSLLPPSPLPSDGQSANTIPILDKP